MSVGRRSTFPLWGQLVFTIACLLASGHWGQAEQVVLSSGPAGDGQMRIRGDQYGAFGPFSVSNAGFGNYNPHGPVGARPWAYWSGMMLTDGVDWQWLMDADDWPGDFGARMPDDAVISDETVGSTRTSRFNVPLFGDLQVDLVQTVSPDNIIQTYTFTNPSNASVELKALWETDVDMEFAQGALDNLAGFVLDDNPRLYFIEESDVAGAGDPGVADRDRRISVVAHLGEHVALEGLMPFRTPVGTGGATHLHFYAQRMFGIEEDYLNTVQEIIGGGNGQPSFEIDDDGDNLMDEPGDVGGAMQFVLSLPANDSATLTLNFVGGSLSNAAFGEGKIEGDYDQSGELDAADLDLQAIQIVAIPGDVGYDLNGDKTVDYLDRLVWVSSLRKTWIGDSNLDGVFNTADFVFVFQAGKYESGEAAGWAQGDWNGDQRFDSSDLVAAFQDGGFEQGVRAAVATVPEPSTLLMSLTSCVMLAWSCRKSGN